VGRLAGLIADGAVSAGIPVDRVFRCRDAGEAGEVLAAHVSEGDAVLLKASRGVRLEGAILKLSGRKEGVLA
jgi:UDP-N-acetylmuramyl pentapeptide synthase